MDREPDAAASTASREWIGLGLPVVVLQAVAVAIRVPVARL